MKNEHPESNDRMDAAEAAFRLSLHETEAMHTTKEEVFGRLLSWNLHPEIVFRLERVWEYTRRVGKRLLHIGQMVVIRIIDFVEAHPHLSVGVALGAALAALTALVPLLGPVLSPVATIVGAILGAAVGYELDAEEKGISSSWRSGVARTIESLVKVAMEFFKLSVELIHIAFSQSLQKG
jgi:hypothetical protein